jgi:predicted metalloendopeptidase
LNFFQVIGHEITHSFDDSGSQFDKYGNLLNWWDNSTREKFNEKVECFVNQYNEYMDPVVGMPVRFFKNSDQI